MKTLFQLAFAAALLTGGAQAATIYISPVPAGINPGDSFDIYLGVVFDKSADPAEQIMDFNFDISFSAGLTAGSPVELGYFRDNGVFFYVSQGPDWITVSDLLSGGDSLMTDDMLFKIPFQYISSTEGPLFVTINEEFTFLDGPDFVPLSYTVSSTTAPTPEPATFALAGTALAVLGWNRIARRR